MQFPDVTVSSDQVLAMQDRVSSRQCVLYCSDCAKTCFGNGRETEREACPQCNVCVVAMLCVAVAVDVL